MELQSLGGEERLVFLGVLGVSGEKVSGFFQGQKLLFVFFLGKNHLGCLFFLGQNQLGTTNWFCFLFVFCLFFLFFFVFFCFFFWVKGQNPRVVGCLGFSGVFRVKSFLGKTTWGVCFLGDLGFSFRKTWSKPFLSISKAFFLGSTNRG